ncbi:hypothetical protein [Streptomyces sp. NPDC054863]
MINQSAHAWEEWSGDARLRNTPEAGRPGNMPAGEDLDLHLGWDRFEKLMLALSRDLLGLRDVRFRRYGVRGQSQHGIDLAGRESDGRYTVVQCKDYKVFRPRDLRAAVERFPSHDKPFKAYRLIIATSASTEETSLTDELALLQDERPDVRLDLWGSEIINDRLRSRADIVSRFWTRETALQFCTAAPLPGVPAPPPDLQTLAERTLVGPLATAEIMPLLREADAKRAEDPGKAARLYGEIAVLLNEAGCDAHAPLLRHRQLDALCRSRLHDEAAALAARLAAVALLHGDRLEPRKLADVLRTTAAAAAEGAVGAMEQAGGTQHHVTLVDSAIRAVQHPIGAPEDLLRALRDTMDADVAYRPLLVLLLAEGLLSTHPGLVKDMHDLLAAAITQANAAPVEGAGDDIVIRLRLALAEHHAPEREELLRSARRHRMHPRHAALISAREARRCCLGGQADQALEGWQDAVHEAIHAGLTEDAADWLYSIRALNVHYSPLHSEIDEELRLAQSLRVSGRGRLLSRIRSPRTQALSALKNQKQIEAVLSARQWLNDTVLMGNWAEELEALDFLGDLYRDNGEPDLAALLYQRAGKHKKSTELAEAVGDRLLPSGSFREGPWWELQAQAAQLARQADLLEDDSVAALLDELIILATQGRAGKLIDSPTGSLSLQAGRSACALAGRSSSEQATALLRMLSLDVPRESGHSQLTDREHVSAAAAIALTHPKLTGTALTRLFDLAEQKVDVALKTLVDNELLALMSPAPQESSGAGSSDVRGPLTEEERVTFRARAHDLVGKGHRLAIVVFASLCPQSPELRGWAQTARDRILDRLEPAPGRITLGSTIITDSWLAHFLDIGDKKTCVAKLLDLAGDSREAASTRQDALTGARNLVLSGGTGSWHPVFLAAREFAWGKYQSGRFDELTGQKSHPLSSFKVNLGSPSLQAHGLRLAGTAATEEEDQRWVREQAIGMLRSADASQVHLAALTLNELPTGVTNDIDPGLLAAHAHPAVRMLSAVLSMRHPQRHLATALRLAEDADVDVRRTLAEASATALSEEHPAVDQVLRLLRQDLRHSVRRAARTAPDNHPRGGPYFGP